MSLINQAVLKDLSKAYDCLPHDLIILKLKAYAFHITSLKLFHIYLSDRKQRVKIASPISEWIYILSVIPQGSIVEPLIFKFLLTISLYLLKKLTSAIVQMMILLCKSSSNVPVVLNSLEHDISIVLNWFRVSSLKTNIKKVKRVALEGKKSFQCKGRIQDIYFFSKDKVALLGTTINNKLTLKVHIENLCKKASYKLHTLYVFLTVIQSKILASSFVNNQFNHCDVIWVFFSGK